MNSQTVTIRKMLAASCEEVFDAWLDAAGMREWMCPGPVTSCEVTLEPRVGGRFRIVMTAPEVKFMNTGEFRVLDRPAKLQFTRASSRWAYRETLVTVELPSTRGSLRTRFDARAVPARRLSRATCEGVDSDPGKARRASWIWR
jgi:uncharacterized protein YndB with AHSA1/START domain